MTLNIIVVCFLAIFAVSCQKIHQESDIQTDKTNNQTEKPSFSGLFDCKNYISNGDFSDDLKGWSYNTKTNIKGGDNQKCVEIQGNSATQIRLWQTVTITSGHVYRLSFKSRANSKGAFAILRNNTTGKEEYLNCEQNDKWNNSWINYKKDFKITNSGNYRLFLSCQGDDTYYFREVSLYDKSNLTIRNSCIIITSIVIIGTLLIVLRKFLFYSIKIIHKLFDKYTADYLLIVIIPIAIYYFGWNYSLRFFIWWFYFSSIHYLWYSKFKCPVVLTPLISLSCTILLLYISGLFGSLHYGFWLLIALGIFGVICAIRDNRTHFWKIFIYQPKEIWLYCFLSLMLFSQSIFLGKGISVYDDQHHWMFIIKGMGYYHTLNDYPIMSIFKNYTTAQALWGYFINRLLGFNFNIPISHWSNVLIYAICFIPGLSLLNLYKNKIKLLPLTLFLLSFILLCANNVCAIPLFLTSFLFLPLNYHAISSYISFVSYFFVYAFLLVVPNLEGSIYRNLPPDIIIYVLPACCLLAYLGCPSLRTLIWLAPVLSLNYLFKIPGLFYSSVISITILIHFIITKRKLLFKRTIWNNPIKYWIVLGFLFIILSLVLPPCVWNFYCTINEHNKTALFKTKNIASISNVIKCFTNDNDPQYFKTRETFNKKLFNNELFKLDYSTKGPLAPALFVDKKICSLLKLRFIPGTYPRFLLIICVFVIFELYLLHRNKFKNYSLIIFLLFIFTSINIACVYINYCLLFTGSEKFVCPSFQRYVAPMLKILIIAVFSGYLIYILNSQKISKLLYSISILIISYSLCKSAGFNYHIKKHTTNTREKFYASLIPDNIDFKDKSLLIVGNAFVKRIENQLGLIYMYYKGSCPKKIHYVLKDDRIDITNFDYIFFLQDDLYSSNKIADFSVLKAIRKRVENENDLKHSCLFNVINSPTGCKLNLVYKSINSNTNILCNSSFDDKFSYWKKQPNSKIVLNRTNNFVSITMPPKIKLYQQIELKKDRNYIIRFNVNNASTINTYGNLGKTYFYCFGNTSLKHSDTFLHSPLDQNVVLILQNNSSMAVEYSDIKVIDLGSQSGKD